jgi:hypothetical protein
LFFQGNNGYTIGKAISITHSDLVFVALGMQHATRMRRTVACPAVHYFFILDNKRHYFRKKKQVIRRNLCVLIVSTTLSEAFLSSCNS